MLAFAHIRKTGGTTLTNMLRRSFGVRHLDRPGTEKPLTARDLQRFNLVCPGLSSIGGHFVQPHAELTSSFPHLRFWTFVRDPLARTISDIKDQLRHVARRDGLPKDLGTAFDELLISRANEQCRHLAGVACAERAISIIERHSFFVGLQESFDASLVMLNRWAGGCLYIRYRPANAATQRRRGLEADAHRRIEAFGRELERSPTYYRRLRQANREDQALYDHVVEDVWRRQELDYGGRLKGDVARFQSFNTVSGFSATNVLAAKLHRNLVLKPLARI